MTRPRPRPTLFVIAEAAERLWEAEMALGDAIDVMYRPAGPQAHEHVPPIHDALKVAQDALDTAYAAAMNAMAKLTAPWTDDAPKTS